MTPDHPDWFGAGDATPAERAAADPAAEYDGADWFDDVEHRDSTPEEEPWSSSPPAASQRDATAGAGASAASSASDGTGADASTSSATTPSTAGANGSDAAADSAPASGRNAGGQSGGTRGGRRRSQQDDSPGGFIAWLKRLLGLD
jgi:hypothetical protein